MDRPGLLWVVVGVALVVVGAPLVGGTGGTVIPVLGALVTLYGAWMVWKPRPSGGG